MENGSKMLKKTEETAWGERVFFYLFPLFKESNADERGLSPKGGGGKDKGVILSF